MWFAGISGKEDDDGKKKQKQPPTSLLSSTAAGAKVPSQSSLPPLHFSSRRSPIYCTNACVATSQPLATSIGLHILRCGGNAADASKYKLVVSI